jgi:hypothetical protein
MAQQARRMVVLAVLVAQEIHLEVSAAVAAVRVILGAAVPRNRERRARAALEGS